MSTSSLEPYYGVRDALVDGLARELVGPGRDDEPTDGEQVLTDPPITRYLSGVLFPQSVDPVDAQEDLDPSPTTDHAGNWDAFVAKLSADGALQWVQMRGAAELDLGASILFSSEYGLFVSGSTGTALEDQPGHGGIDAFVSRYAP